MQDVSTLVVYRDLQEDVATTHGVANLVCNITLIGGQLSETVVGVKVSAAHSAIVTHH